MRATRSSRSPTTKALFVFPRERRESGPAFAGASYCGYRARRRRAPSLRESSCPRTRRRSVPDASRRLRWWPGRRAQFAPLGEDGHERLCRPGRPTGSATGNEPLPRFRFQVSRPAADNSIRPAALSGGAAGTFLGPPTTQSEAAASPNDSSMGGDVWVELYEAEAFLRAQRLMAAAIGALAGHEALLDQLGAVSEWVFADEADSDQIAERFTRFTAMLLLLGKEGTELSRPSSRRPSPRVIPEQSPRRSGRRCCTCSTASPSACSSESASERGGGTGRARRGAAPAAPTHLTIV